MNRLKEYRTLSWKEHLKARVNNSEDDNSNESNKSIKGVRSHNLNSKVSASIQIRKSLYKNKVPSSAYIKIIKKYISQKKNY